MKAVNGLECQSLYMRNGRGVPSVELDIILVYESIKLLTFPEKVQEAIHADDLPYTMALKRFGSMSTEQLERLSQTLEKTPLKDVSTIPGTNAQDSAGTTRVRSEFPLEHYARAGTYAGTYGDESKLVESIIKKAA